MSYRRSYNRNSYGSYSVVECPLFKTLKDIETVLDELKKNIDKKGYATLEDFYVLTGGNVVNGDSEHGWYELLNVSIENTRYGYLLRMPITIVISNDPIRDAITVLQEADEDRLYDAVQDACYILEGANK